MAITEIVVEFPDPLIATVVVNQSTVIATAVIGGAGSGSVETPATIKTKYESNADTNAFSDAEQTKLAGIEAGASADLTGAEIVALIGSEADSNLLDDAEVAKLAAVDWTGAAIAVLYEAETDRNPYTDAEQAKLAGLDADATDDQTPTEIKDAYATLVPQVTAPEISAGTQPAIRTVSPADVVSFITAHGLKPSDINTLSELNSLLSDADLIDDGDARLSDARTPVAHSHPISDVTALQAELDAVQDRLPLAGGTMTGDIDMGGSGSITNVAQILDVTILELNASTGVIVFPTNVRQQFKPGATTPGLNAGAVASDPAGSRLAGDLWFNSTSNELKMFNGTYDQVIATLDSALSVLGGNMWGAIVYQGEVRQVFKPGLNVAGVNVGAVTDAPSTLINGDIWYNSGDDELEARIDGATRTIATTANLANYLSLIGGTLFGPLSTSSTIDGRDVSVDGAKLDGIEPGATADQSAAEIETAYSSQVPQVSAGEITAGAETAIRTVSPADVVAFITAHGGDLSAADIDTLAELNAILTDATLIDTADARLSDARTPTAHTHPAADVSDASANGRALLTAADYAAMKALLDLEIGTDVQAQSAVLDATTASFLAADETKLDGIATGATANDTDANLKARANHTGVQAISTVTDLQTTLDAKVELNHLNLTTAARGGGTVTYNASGYLKWSARLIVLPLSQSYATSGYVLIETPLSGTIPYFGAGATETTKACTADGILIGSYEALYYNVNPAVVTSSSVKFALVRYNNTLWEFGEDWIPIASNTGDSTELMWHPGNIVMPLNSTFNSVTGACSWLAKSTVIPDHLAQQTLTDAATITWDASLGVNAKVTLGGNRTLGAMTLMVTGESGTLTVIQDGTGSRGLTLNAQYVVISGDVADVATQAAGKRSFLSWQYDATSAKIYLWITHEP